MKLLEPITEESLADEINRICGSTVNSYPNKSKIARVNEALNKYWFLASQSAPKGSFDDVDNSSLPVETKNLTDGGNYFKISKFTNKILQILRIAILNDSDSDEIDLIREEFDDIGVFNELYSTDSDKRDQPAFWTKMGDFIYIRPCPNYAKTDGLRVYLNRELSKFTWNTFTANATTDKLTKTTHGLSDGDSVILISDGTIPTGLTADTVIYYVVNKTPDTFEVATTPGGTKVTITDAQTSYTHKFVKVSKEPGIPLIHHNYIAEMASLPYLVEKKLPQLGAISQLITKDERDILEYWKSRGKELKTIIKVKQSNFL